MQHTIQLENYGPQGEAMATAVEKCVHCGFCLSACPTYKTMGEEMDSPRGRIYLMKEVMEDNLALDEMLPFMDRCLGCMGCITACPSGVEYGDLLTPFRAHSESKRARTPMDKVTRLLVHETLPYPRRFRLAAAMGKIARPLKGFLPSAFGSMLDLIPANLPPAEPLPERYPLEGIPSAKRRARVALLAGCVQQVLAPQINWATLRVLARNGVEVVIPKQQGCCGSLAMHTGEGKRAESLARHNIDVFNQLDEVDAIVTNAAGCGSGMHEYTLLFKGTALEEQATHFAHKVRDISVFLTELGIDTPEGLPTPTKLAYHDACHLAHAQRVTAEPRQLLQQIPNVQLLEIPEGDLCCGSAGTYNLEQPELAHEIGTRKANNIRTVNADGVVMGNIGCMTQIQMHLDAQGEPLPVLHTIEVLDRAYRNA